MEQHPDLSPHMLHQAPSLCSELDVTLSPHRCPTPIAPLSPLPDSLLTSAGTHVTLIDPSTCISSDSDLLPARGHPASSRVHEPFAQVDPDPDLAVSPMRDSPHRSATSGLGNPRVRDPLNPAHPAPAFLQRGPRSSAKAPKAVRFVRDSDDSNGDEPRSTNKENKWGTSEEKQGHEWSSPGEEEDKDWSSLEEEEESSSENAGEGRGREIKLREDSPSLRSHPSEVKGRSGVRGHRGALSPLPVPNGNMGAAVPLKGLTKEGRSGKARAGQRQGEGDLSQPVMHTSRGLRGQIEAIERNQLDLPRAVQRMVNSSEALRKGLQAKVFSQLNVKDPVYHGLVPLDVPTDLILQSTGRSQPRSEIRRRSSGQASGTVDEGASLGLSRFFTTERYSEDLLTTFDPDLLTPGEPMCMGAPASSAFDVYHHMMSWQTAYSTPR